MLTWSNWVELHCTAQKKLKYLWYGSVTVHSWFASGALEVRSRYAQGLLLVRSEYAESHLSFRCSSEWLERFKIRHSIVFRRMCGESAAVTAEMMSDCLTHTLPSVLAEYRPENVFNADETGLFWKCLPDKTMALKGDTCSGGKRSKERITVMVCASMAGEQVVIGKYKKPGCFKNIRSLPVMYKANTRAWMVSELFTEWLIDLDKKFYREGRK